MPSPTLLLALALLPAQGVRLEDPKHGKIVSEKAIVKVSTTCGYDTPETHLNLVRGAQVEFAFHTDSEKNPWVVLKLPAHAVVTGFRIVNRTNAAHHSRAAGLTVSLSNDGKAWREVWKADKPEAEWKVSLLATKKSQRALYVKLETKSDPAGPFHLSKVFIHGK